MRPPPLFFRPSWIFTFNPNCSFCVHLELVLQKGRNLNLLAPRLLLLHKNKTKLVTVFLFVFFFLFFFLPSKFTRRKWKLILFSLMIIYLDGISIYSPPPHSFYLLIAKLKFSPSPPPGKSNRYKQFYFRRNLRIETSLFQTRRISIWTYISNLSVSRHWTENGFLTNLVFVMLVTFLSFLSEQWPQHFALLYLVVLHPFFFSI